MPFSPRMARFNLRFTNHLMRHVAARARGFAIVKHTGRRSGRRYETPVNAFRCGNRYVFALTYGESDWVKNVLAARRCSIRTRRREVELADPELLNDPTRHLVPRPARWILELVKVEDFLLLQEVKSDQTSPSRSP
jgi:deazaflavin-dependent oxidoreductase (nitroreductase family)